MEPATSQKAANPAGFWVVLIAKMNEWMAIHDDMPWTAAPEKSPGDGRKKFLQIYVGAQVAE
jgi:hypothetical protein